VKASTGIALAVFVTACASDVPVTVREGTVLQSVETLHPTFSRVELVIVLDDANEPTASDLRTAVLRALEADALSAIESPGWTPVDVRAYVAIPGGTAFATPAGDPVLEWRDDRASADGALRFLQTIADVVATPADPPRTSGIAALRAGLALASDAGARRIVVLASGRDDPEAIGDSVDLFDVARDEPRVIVSDSATELARWAGPAVVVSPDVSLSFLEPFGYARCAAQRIARDADTTPRCRVRAFHRDAKPCDPRRGHIASVPPSTPEGATACDVARLDSETCIAQGVARTASGWCVPPSAGRCGAFGFVTFVGGALEPFTDYELACEYAP
jgi:hypothetical protein